jgi:ribonucleotide monophosphatase NagD (HAD superfamily)
MPRIFSDIDGTVLREGKVVEPVVEFLREEAEEVVFLTNRPEADRDKTERDLEAVGLEYERLIMNPGDEEAPTFKARVIKEEYLDKGLRADALVDDREDTRAAVERLGVRTLSPDEVEAYMAEEEAEDADEEQAKVAASRKFMTPEDIIETLKTDAVALIAERDDLRASVEKLTVNAGVELEAAKVEAAAHAAKAAELTTALEAADKLVAELTAKVAALEASAISASAEAAKIAASVGVEPVEQTPADAPVKTADDIRAEFLAMPFGKARTAFFNQHRATILGR